LSSLNSAPDLEDARTRLRAAIRRIVESIWCVFVAKGPGRLAAVQLFFAGGATRSYLIHHKRGYGNFKGVRRPPSFTVRSFADQGGGFDLRNPAHAAELAAKLEADPGE
jgi:hypothetical protein